MDLACLPACMARALLRACSGRSRHILEEQATSPLGGGGCSAHWRPVGACRLPARLQVVAKAADIQKSISEGAQSFLATQYYYLGIFMVGRQGRYRPQRRLQRRLQQRPHDWDTASAMRSRDHDVPTRTQTVDAGLVPHARSFPSAPHTARFFVLVLIPKTRMRC